MADTSSFPSYAQSQPRERPTPPDIEANRFTVAALERHKREGMELAVRARWAALGVVAVMLPFLNPRWDVLYHIFLLGLLALVGLLARRVARVGVSRLELAVLFLDLALLTFILAVPNPFSPDDWPTAANYKFETFQYFFIILAAGTLAYSWRTIVAIGTWTSGLWMAAAVAIWWFGRTDPEMTAAVQAEFGHDPGLAHFIDPNNVGFDLRIQQVVVFLIVALTLAVSVRRFNRLLLTNASLERERENLSRYFSPNVVNELSHNDEPLKQVRSHEIAVLFVDIVDFTAYSSERDPTEVIETLRAFHALMEAEVFRYDGTLDKYLGDGLMATFGTPVAGDRDATNALRCARAMKTAVDIWNRERARKGEPAITASFGLHYGPVVLADIGTNRLEYAVVGNTVNVASRIEALTRVLPGQIAFSETLRERVMHEAAGRCEALEGEACQREQVIRGLDRPVSVWTLE